jgi:PHS family inorganic phosphate transporter-like MFS transporter
MCMLPSTSLLRNVLITSITDGIELMIIVTATFAQALAGSGLGVNIIGVLMVWRFIMGVGVGGDYPLSAVISSEFASTSSRGRLMTTVFTAQGWGNFGKQHCSCVRSW